jgi:hypothetical protein
VPLAYSPIYAQKKQKEVKEDATFQPVFLCEEERENGAGDPRTKEKSEPDSADLAIRTVAAREHTILQSVGHSGS